MSSDIFRPENNSKCFKIKLIAYKFFLTEFIGTPYDGIKIFTDNPIIIKGNAEKFEYTYKKRYTIENADINAALARAKADGFENRVFVFEK